MTAESLVEQLGLLGVFIAGAIPWLEAVVVIPVGIAVGLPPIWTLFWGLLGNALTIGLFAFASEQIMDSVRQRREKRGLATQPNQRLERARRIFQRYGVFGMAVLGPLVIGTQIAAAWAVSFGVSAWRATVIVTAGAVVWALVTGLTTWAIVG